MKLEDIFVKKINEFNNFIPGDEPMIFKESKILSTHKSEIDEDLEIIFSLVYNYQGSKEVGNYLILDTKIYESSNFYMFGRNLSHGYDYVIDKGSKEILEVNEQQNIFYACSKNPKSFIEVMIMCIDVYIEHLRSESYDAVLDKDKCINIAGGDKYRKFFDSLDL